MVTTIMHAFLSPLPWKKTREVSSPWKRAAIVLFYCFTLVMGYSALLSVMAKLFNYCSPILAMLAFGAKFHLLPMLLFGYLISNSKKSELEKQEALSALDNEHSSRLTAQLDAHTIFNLFNTLAAMAAEFPDKAVESLECLGGYYQHIVQFSKLSYVELSQEKYLLELYLTHEQNRFCVGEGLDVQWDWDDRLNKVDVPPLILQPLVENAIKHAIAPMQGGWLRIIAQPTDQGMRLEVENPKPPEALKSKQASTHTGVENLEARLEHYYKNRVGKASSTSRPEKRL